MTSSSLPSFLQQVRDEPIETFSVIDVINLTSVFVELEFSESVIRLGECVTGIPAAAVKTFMKTDTEHFIRHLVWCRAMDEFLTVPLWRQLAEQYPAVASPEIFGEADLAQISRLPQMAGKLRDAIQERRIDPLRPLLLRRLDEDLLVSFRNALYDDDYRSTCLAEGSKSLNAFLGWPDVH